MAFSPAKTIESAKQSNGTGISLSMSVAPKSKKASVRLTMNTAAQERLFGRVINSEKDRFDVLIGRGQDQGMMRLRLDPDADFVPKGGIKGCITLRIAAWDLLPAGQGKMPAAECQPIGEVSQEGKALAVTIALPHWADPAKRERDAMKAKMSAKTDGRAY